MADIIEVITKLTVDVGSNAGLQQQIDMFKKEAESIENLKKLLKQYEISMTSVGDKNSVAGKNLQNNIDKTTKQINLQTEALKKQVVQSGIIQKAEMAELGIIQKLTDKINDLRRAREKQTTKENLAEVNKEIEIAKKELQDLLSTGKEKKEEQKKEEKEDPFGFALVGDSIKDEAKSALTGLAQGLGIGTGLSILPGLVDGLVEYGFALLDTREAVEKAEEAVVSFNSALVQELQAVDGLQESLSKFFGTGITNFEQEIARAEALGVVEGETFAARKKRYEAEQGLREEQLRLQDAENEKYARLFRALQRYDNIGNLGVLKDTLSTLGLSQANLDKINLQIDGLFQKIKDLPRSVRAKALTDLKLAENDELLKFIADRSFDANKLQQQIDNAKIEFEQETANNIYELNKKLTADLASLRDKAEQEDIARQEASRENIEKSFLIKGKAAVRELNLEVEQARKAGTLNGKARDSEFTNQELFDQKFALLVQENEANKIEALRQFNQQQVKEQEKLNAQLLQTELAGLQQRVQFLTGTDLQTNIDLRNTVVDAELMAQMQANSAQYDEQVSAHYKRLRELEAAGKQESEEYKHVLETLSLIYGEYVQKQEQAEKATQQKRIQNLQQGYADVLAEVNRSTAEINAAIAKSFSAEQREISEGGGGFFGRDFKLRLAGLRQVAAQEKANIEQALQLRIAAQARFDAANAARKAANTPEGVKATQQQVDAAITELDKLDTAINQSNTKINDSTRKETAEFVNAYVDAFTQITSAAAQAYNTLQQYRLQDLEREISAREQRVSVALELAEKGNTQILDIEVKALREAQQERRKAALQQQAINSAMQLSYALLAVAKAAAEGGGIASIATVAAAVGAIISGYSLVRGLDRGAQTEGFKDGVVGYKGKGTGRSDSNLVRISAGESIMTEAATKRNRPMLEAMNRGYMLAAPVYAGQTPSRGEFDGLRSEMRGVREAVEGQRLNVRNTIDERGISLITEREQRKERLKYKK